MSAGGLSYCDYELDVIKCFGEIAVVADEDEFELVIEQYGYDRQLVKRCRTAVEQVTELLEQWKSPDYEGRETVPCQGAWSLLKKCRPGLPAWVIGGPLRGTSSVEGLLILSIPTPRNPACRFPALGSSAVVSQNRVALQGRFADT